MSYNPIFIDNKLIGPNHVMLLILGDILRKFMNMTIGAFILLFSRLIFDPRW